MKARPSEATFRRQLLAWYDAHARDLPWRESRDPYRVWLSEIMLQQTRVTAVIAHYHEFLRRFPTVKELAAARESSVLAAWSGLGYYRRARLLHAAAKVIVGELVGKFPVNAAGLRELPGIGRYTAAAVASIAFGEPVAVVDGNVERVLQRISGKRLAGEQLWAAAEEFLERERPGAFNQAMMELGATVCTPRAPVCMKCPVAESCATRGEMSGVARVERQKKREIHYMLHAREGKVFLVQRARDARLMAGMWELPETTVFRASAGGKPILRVARNDKKSVARNDENTAAHNSEASGEADAPLFSVKHSITVTDYTVRVWRRAVPDESAGKWIASRRLGRLAMTGLTRKILRRAALLANE